MFCRKITLFLFNSITTKIINGKINDILNNIKDRLSNPLIFSFVCSWLVINWQIPVALIWYDPKQIENEKCPSLFQFIIDRLNTNDSIYYPLVIAILYVVAMPIIKNLIRAFNTWTTKWGEDWNLKILKGGNIGIDKFLKLRSDYKNAMQKLQEVISEESDYIHKLNNVNSKLLDLQNTHNHTLIELSEKEDFIKASQNFSVLDGVWEVKVNTQGEVDVETVEIRGGGYNINLGFGNKETKYAIKNDIFFIKEEAGGPESPQKRSSKIYKINRLKFEGKDKLIGTEDNFQIEYNRKS